MIIIYYTPPPFFPTPAVVFAEQSASIQGHGTLSLKGKTTRNKHVVHCFRISSIAWVWCSPPYKTLVELETNMLSSPAGWCAVQWAMWKGGPVTGLTLECLWKQHLWWNNFYHTFSCSVFHPDKKIPLNYFSHFSTPDNFLTVRDPLIVKNSKIFPHFVFDSLNWAFWDTECNAKKTQPSTKHCSWKNQEKLTEIGSF